ncbi:replication protein A 14 kDa subunit isoform X2 [Narcine bancroftii]|uniref:replication protein A 14 kDa subunit isoform X2 n=1 Tax=Narcine bancroftii TaxID=1343680 RepID=UPI003831AC48
MVDILEGPRPRINAGLVPEFQDRAVHPTGTSFILSDGDGKNVTVEITDPLDEELSGVIEVVGKVTQKATIKAAYYTTFREDKNSFDLGLYNEAVCLLHEFSQYYPFGVTGNS